jgi:hypothetical protein
MTSHIVNFGPFFVQLQPNSIQLNKDEDDEQTEGAMVKRLVFYFDLHLAWDSTINRKQYGQANKHTMQGPRDINIISNSKFEMIIHQQQ